MSKYADKLPTFCFAIHPVNKQVIGIYRNESGYVETDDMIVYDAKLSNEMRGVTCAQVNAMVAGSMFSWDIPAADPDSPANQFFDPYKVD